VVGEELRVAMVTRTGSEKRQATACKKSAKPKTYNDAQVNGVRAVIAIRRQWGVAVCAVTNVRRVVEWEQM